eukprot:5696796-Prorocentrum_lima.AAC.1
MQPGVFTLVASSSGQGQVPALTAPTGQDTVDQPTETPLSTSWQYGQLPRTVPQAFTPNPHVAAASTWPN